MPDLRLTDEEASHITAYLLTEKNEEFENQRLPYAKPEVVDELALSFMTSRLRYQEAKDELDKMAGEERLEYVGKKSIGHFGCYGCHSIKGFEDAKKIGTELTDEGNKPLERLDFGLIDIPHTHRAWFFQKLKNPRIFDEGKVKLYHEKLRMPQFDFTDEEAETLTTFILSLEKTDVPLSKQRLLSVDEEKVELGRQMTAKYNCQGCHTLDGKEGMIRELTEDAGNMPPVLDGEGLKVKENWLYHFLENPVPVRPWLKYRMPTFHFSEEEVKVFVDYFHHLAKAEPSYLNEMAPETTPEEIAAGRELFKKFQCIKCHKANPDPALSSSFLAPNLVMADKRLKSKWMVDWMEDPQKVQEGTMMPTFFADGQSPLTDVLGGDAKKQIKALRDYMLIFDEKEAALIEDAAKQPVEQKQTQEETV